MKAKPRVNEELYLRTCRTCGENYLSKIRRKCLECEQNKTNEFIKKYPWKFVEEREEECPVEEAIKIELKQVVKKAFNYLTPREQKVLKMRYGIGIDNDYSLVETGKYFDMTRERIRQIETKAIRKLRRPHFNYHEGIKNFLREYKGRARQF